MGRIVTATTYTTTIKLYPEDRTKMAQAIHKVLNDAWNTVEGIPGPNDPIWEDAAEAAVNTMEFEGAERKVDHG